MHPFGDGNGRTARAVEAFMLKQAGINAPVPVSLSNYYYAYREDYFGSLYASRQARHDITPFLRFALPAVTAQCNSVAGEIIVNHKRALFRELARSLFVKLRSPRRRVLAERQLHILDALLGIRPAQRIQFDGAYRVALPKSAVSAARSGQGHHQFERPARH